MKSLSFLDLLKAVTIRWYILVIGMIIGGMFGWGATIFLPSMFESDAAFNVTIDYTQTGALSDVEEDQAMRGVGDIIFSDEIVSATLDTLKKNNGLDLSKDEFYDDAIFDREEFRWAIRYRDADPFVASTVVDAWASEADRFLQDSLQHAKVAASYQEVLSGLENCLQRTTQMNNSDETCSLDNLDQIIDEIDQVSELITTEKEQSRGLFAAVSVQLLERAEVPNKPMRYQVNVLVISGAFVGLLTAMVLLIVRIQNRNKQSNG